MLESHHYISPVGVDRDSFVFSCAWGPDMAKIFKHWFEKQDGEIFHVNLLKDNVMRREQEIRGLRRDIHKILNWGLLVYRTNAQAVFDRVMVRVQEKAMAGSGYE